MVTTLHCEKTKQGLLDNFVVPHYKRFQILIIEV